MGWRTKHKAKLLGPVFSLHTELPKADIVAVDANAQLRAATGKHPAPPRRIAESLGRLIVAANPRIVIICFDNEHIPERRRQVQQERAARISLANRPVATPAIVNKATMESLGETTWEALWNNPAGKRKMFRLLFESLKRFAIAGLGHSAEWIITEPYGNTVWSYPFGRHPSVVPELTGQRYGEAEAQVVMAVQHYVTKSASAKEPIPRSLILTIDTDMLIQMSGILARNVDIAISQVWRAPSGEVFRGRKDEPACKKLLAFWHNSAFTGKRVWELVSMNKLQEGRSRSKLMWYQFVWMCVGGVDYCKGLGRFGFQITDKKPHKSVAVWLTKPSPFTITDTGFTLDLKQLCRIMSFTRASPTRLDTANKKGGGAKEFVAELNNILYCLEYYVWFNATRPDVAGPVAKEFIAEPRQTRVSQWLVACGNSGPVVESINTYPCMSTLDPASHGADTQAVSDYLGL
ncbi:MAG: hypothetical protein ACPGR8_01215 [Limisphaerales bacterium]